MRVTQSTLYLTMQHGLDSSLEQVSRAQTEMSTGKRINKYSDDPTAAVNVLRTQSKQSSYSDYDTAATDAGGWLSAQDSALQNAAKLIDRARQLALNGANSAAQDSDTRSALAAEVAQIRDQIASIANTTYLDRPVFGGFGQTAVTQDATGKWQYAGDGGKVLRQVSPNDTVTVNVDGSQVFGFGSGNDIFGVLDQLKSDLTSGNDAGIAAGITNLDARTTDIYQGLEQVGATQNHVEDLATRGKDQQVALLKVRSDLEDVDLAQATIDMQNASNAFQATLAATAKANIPSLAQYLS